MEKRNKKERKTVNMHGRFMHMPFWIVDHNQDFHMAVLLQ